MRKLYARLLLKLINPALAEHDRRKSAEVAAHIESVANFSRNALASVARELGARSQQGPNVTAVSVTAEASD
jgi:hypothetical protein